MSLGRNIAVYRKRKGFTQEELGQLLGVTNQAVSKWESETSMPDVMLLPRIADALAVSVDNLFTDHTVQTIPSKTFNMDAVHSFPNDMQTTVMDSLCRKTNLVNCRSWELLKAEQNTATNKYDHIRPQYTVCCLSDTQGAAFVSNTLTAIDADLKPADISSVFDKFEIASCVKKLSDANVRRVLSHICNTYFQRTAHLIENDPEFFTIRINPTDLSKSLGLCEEEMMEVLEKLIALHIAELETTNGTHYLLHKVKVIEAAVTLRLMERFIHNEAGFGCGNFLALVQY